MGMVQRFERKLQSAVGDAFARVFGGGVLPQEVEAALRQEAAASLEHDDNGRTVAPNLYVITINESDHERFAEDRELTTKAFSRHLQDHIREQGWTTQGEVHVRFEPAGGLHTGMFRTSSAADPGATYPGRAPDEAPARPGTRTKAPNEPNLGSVIQVPERDEPSPRPPEHPHDPISGAGSMSQNQGQSSDGHQNGRAYSGAAQYDDYPPEDSGNRVQPPNNRAEADDYDDPRGYDPAYRGGGGGYPDQRYGGYGREYDPGYGDRGGDRGADRGGYDQRYQDDPRRRAYPDHGYGRPERPEYDQAPPRAYEQGYGEPAYRGGPDYDGYQDDGYAQSDYRDGRYAQQGYAEPAYEAPAAREPDYGRGGYQGNYGQQGGQSARVVTATLQLEDGSGRYFQLREGVNIVGRGQDAQFRVPDTGISRRHLEIRWDGRVAMLTDLGSTNGTTVNGAQVGDWQLADGDIIRAGHSEILVRIG